MRKIIALAAALMLMTSGVAQAAFTISFNGGSPMTNGTDFISGSGLIPGTSVLAVSYSAGAFSTPTQADVFQSAFTLLNTSTSVQTVTIEVSKDLLTQPGNSNSLLSLLATLSVNPASVGGYSVQSTATASPNPASVSTAILTSHGTSSNSTLFQRSASTYTLTNVITLTLEANARVQFQSDSIVGPAGPSVLFPTPAPAGLVLAALGIPLFAGLRRFRKPAATETLAA